MKLDKNQIRKLVAYVPAGHPAKTQYVNMVNTMVLGTDSKGQSRPIEDLFYFMQVSKNAGLDPTLKQIYAVYRWNSTQGKEVMSIQTGIDGMRNIAERTGNYGGSNDAVFEGQITLDMKDSSGNVKSTIKVPSMAIVTVFKLNPKTGERMPTSASARWSEYYPGDKQGMMWRKMPHTMLAKVAEALALRKAFPVASQIYVTEEMQQATEVLPEPKKVEPKEIKGNIEEITKKVKAENEKA